MTINVLDLENWSAQGATAELVRKTLTVRLSFQLNGAPDVKLLSSIGRGNARRMVPNLLVVEYSKMNDGPWKITLLRTYGHQMDEPDKSVVNIYPHDSLYNNMMVPAWIRDAAYDGMPK